jgi:hypothetical protein
VAIKWGQAGLAKSALAPWRRDGHGILDILLIDALGELNYPETANVARRVFEERATHAFPPQFVMPQEWRPELEALAVELDFPLMTSSAIEQRFLEVIQMLERAARAHE